MKITKFYPIILFLLLAVKSYGQIINVDYTHKKDNGQELGQHQFLGDIPKMDTTGAPQILKSGFVNYLTNGAVQASANLLRINIGEQTGFYIPFYIYTGTAGSGLGNAKASETSIANLLNPIGGTLNLSFQGEANLYKSKTKITSLKFNFQIGGRLSSGKDSLTQTNFTFFNGMANAGLYFQTGAWTTQDPNNMGVAFLMVKAIGTFAAKDNYQRILADNTLTKNYLIGYSIDAGVEINKVIDLKAGVYQFTNDNASAILKKPTVNFSLNYSFGK